MLQTAVTTVGYGEKQAAVSVFANSIICGLRATLTASFANLHLAVYKSFHLAAHVRQFKAGDKIDPTFRDLLAMELSNPGISGVNGAICAMAYRDLGRFGVVFDRTMIVYWSRRAKRSISGSDTWSRSGSQRSSMSALSRSCYPRTPTIDRLEAREGIEIFGRHSFRRKS